MTSLACFTPAYYICTTKQRCCFCSGQFGSSAAFKWSLSSTSSSSGVSQKLPPSAISVYLNFLLPFFSQSKGCHVRLHMYLEHGLRKYLDFIQLETNSFVCCSVIKYQPWPKSDKTAQNTHTPLASQRLGLKIMADCAVDRRRSNGIHKREESTPSTSIAGFPLFEGHRETFDLKAFNVVRRLCQKFRIQLWEKSFFIKSSQVQTIFFF